MNIKIMSLDCRISIVETIHDGAIFQPVITVETSDYMIEIKNNGEYYVSNAMNGYGYNCREDFKDAIIEIYP